MSLYCESALYYEKIQFIIKCIMLEEFSKERNGDESVSMCQALEELREDARIEGRAEEAEHYVSMYTEH